MEKKSSQIENCCGNMMKSGGPMMEKMMQHMQEFMGQESKDKRNEHKPISLNNKEKELVLLSASISTGCKPCREFHVKKATEVGLSDIAIKKAIEGAYAIRLKSSEIMLNHGLKLLKSDEKIRDAKTDLNEISRDDELVSIAASYAANCTQSLEQHISRGKKADITDNEILEIAELVKFVEKKAKVHADKIVPNMEVETEHEEKFTKNSCC